MADEISPSTLKNVRSDDFESCYANNIAVEGSIWDLKVVFGELDQSAGAVVQHTAVTLPWAAVKLMLYLIRAQVVGYETINGKIQVVKDVLPAEVAPPPEQYKDNPTFQKAFEALKRLREEFIKDA